MAYSENGGIKVAQVLYTGLGGQGSVFASLAEAAAGSSTRFQVVFYGTEPLMPGYRAFCEQHKLPYKVVQKKPGFDLASWKNVYRALQHLKPDAILLHSLNLVVVAAWYCIRHGCRLIAVEHTPNTAKRKSEWVWTLIGLLVSARIVVLSAHYLAELRARFGWLVSPGKVRVIPNGINTAPYSCLRDYSKPPIILAMHSRFSAAKDHDTLLLAFRQLVLSEPGCEHLQLHLAGDGPTLAQVKELASDLSISASVIFHGMLPSEQVIPFLCQADMYIYSSLAETACTSVLQAMASGLPVVASDIPGVNNLVSHRKSGLLYPAGDFNQLAACALQLVSQPNLRQALGIGAKNRAEAVFSHRKQFLSYSGLWYN